MPTQKRTKFDKIKKKHRDALLSFINESTQLGVSSRAITQSFGSLVKEAVSVESPKSEAVELTAAQYLDLVNNHADVVNDLYARVKTLSPDGDGCVFSSAQANSTRPKVAVTVGNRSCCPFQLPCNFTQASVVLINDGQVPKEDDYTASHRCHKNKCVKLSHLLWEPEPDNIRRRACAAAGTCKCGLAEKCIF